MANPQNHGDKVRTYLDELTLPTYALLGENRNPVFHSQYGVAHIYPYTLLDEIAPRPSPRTYKTLNLENEYLRVTVLPELGGRVFSVFSKIDQSEVFYKNSIIKFSPLAIRGAFFSGGIEFSFPVAHAPTTADPVNWDLVEYPDGSAAIHIGGLEHISGMRWTISLTLYPGRCALAQDVRLFNPTPTPGRYHYWTNASLDSDDQTEFIYPLRRVRSYEFAGTSSWPVARLDLITGQPGLPGMEGVPMWPADRMHEPVNFRREEDMLAQVSIFGRDVAWDFFGAWQHSSNRGYAHFADHKDVSGMKLWSWGRSDVGIINQTALTDDGSLYAETQCGAMETQLDFDFLPPGETKSWREWWLPLRSLNGLTCASEELGALLKITPGIRENQVELSMGVCPATTLEGAQVEVSIPNSSLLRTEITASPEAPWTQTLSIEASRLAHHPLTLKVHDQAGNRLLDYTLDREPEPGNPGLYDNPEPREKGSPTTHPETETAEDHYQAGLYHENFDNRQEALESYARAVALSPAHGPAQMRLGIMHLRAANFDRARDHFEAALSHGETSTAYYLGLIAWYLGRAEQAGEYFKQLTDPGSPYFSSGLCRLGGLAIHQKKWDEARSWFIKAGEYGDTSILTTMLEIIAANRGDQAGEAANLAEQCLAEDPLNLVVLRELSLLEEPPASAGDKLARLLADDPQYHLDLAAFYLDWGLPEDALSVLELAAGEWDYPMVGYLAAFIEQHAGRQPEAARWLAKARESGPDFVFPSRLWEAIALEQHLNNNVGDVKAKYYLGNFYYAHQRCEEAVSLWQAAAEGLDSYDVIFRNLGWHAWKQEKNLDQAITLFEKALALNPMNQDLYIYLDELYKAQELPEKREALLSETANLSPIREDVRKRRLIIMVDLGRHEQALEILTQEQFVPLEMDQSFHKIYVQALLQRAEARMEAEGFDEAIAAYEAALEYLPNLGVGRPTTPESAEVLYRLGCAYERMGHFSQAINAWQAAALEHHPFGMELYPFVQMSLDKLSRYSELGFEI